MESKANENTPKVPFVSTEIGSVATRWCFCISPESQSHKVVKFDLVLEIFTLPETNIAGWKIHHFDGMKPRKDGIFMGELLVSGRVAVLLLRGHQHKKLQIAGFNTKVHLVDPSHIQQVTTIPYEISTDAPSGHTKHSGDSM